MELDSSHPFHSSVEGLKYFIKNHDVSSSSNRGFYLVTMTSTIKIPNEVKAYIQNGQSDWLNNIEILDVQISEDIIQREIPVSVSQINNLLQSDDMDVKLTAEILENFKKESTNFSLEIQPKTIPQIPETDITEENIEGDPLVGDDESEATTNKSSESLVKSEFLPDNMEVEMDEDQNVQPEARSEVKEETYALEDDDCSPKTPETRFKRRTRNRNSSSHKKDKGSPKKGGECKHCGKYFRNLTYHLPVHLSERPFQCSQCDKSFKSEPVLRQHMYFHSGQKPFSCDVCEKSFALKNTLASHMRSHTGEKPFICHVCGASYRRGQELKIHVAKHSGEKPFSCDFCGKTFCSKYDIKAHRRLHTAELKYICEICGKKFRAQGILNVHRKIHSAEKNFACDLCSSSFATKGYLAKHKKTHDKKREFKCEDCNKLFKTLHTYNKHRQVQHSQERPFECDVCLKTFKLGYVLQQHQRLHRDVKDYVCQFCEKSFTFKSSLSSHLKNHHKQEQLNVSMVADIQEIIIPPFSVIQVPGVSQGPSGSEISSIEINYPLQPIPDQ